MGCGTSHLQNEADYFLNTVYSTFPLNNYSFEQIEDLYEKHLDEVSDKEHFLETFQELFTKEFKNDEKKTYHVLMIQYIVQHLTLIFDNNDLFKYNFFLFIFPYLHHNTRRNDKIEYFMEIITHLCDLKKTQINVVQELKGVLLRFYIYVLYDIPNIFANYISETKAKNNEDLKYLTFLKNKIYCFNRKKVEDLIYNTINSYFSLLGSHNMKDALGKAFQKLPLNYNDIQQYFSLTQN